MQTSNSPANNSHLSVLVNPQGIRSSIKRLFRNNISECISEMAQNSQRAGARNVAIKTTPEGFSFEDDGHGILNGLDGFHVLLKLAESNFDNPTIDDQDPMGIGIASLLTHDQIEEVTFVSGNLQLSIDVSRWWTDAAYYSTWFQRITTPTEPVSGFLVDVRCKPQLTTALVSCLTAVTPLLYSSNEGASPVRGYEGILNVTLDGEALNTSIPPWAVCKEPLITTKYKGCQIQIAYDAKYTSRSCVRWFGQLITVPISFGGYQFYLDVQEGRPVNPLSPSRRGLIQDDALKALLTFVENQIFAFVFDPKNRQKIKPHDVHACFAMNQQRALRESPYITARQLHAIHDPDSIEDAQPEASEPVIFSYDEAPVLINEPLNVILQDDCLPHEYGLHSLVSLLDKPYALQHGDTSRLRIAQAYWRPGSKTKEFFRKPGQFALSYVPGATPDQWQDVGKEPIFAFNDPGTDLSWTDFVVGTTNPIEFLQNEVWAAFSPSDDYDHDPQRDTFQESCEALIREFMGKCVPRNFEHYHFDPFLKKDEAVRTLEYRYPRGTLKRDGTPRIPAASPNGLIVQTTKKRTIRLRFY